MDVESAKDNQSFEDGKMLVFVHIIYKIRHSTRWSIKKKDPRRKKHVILNEACGAIRPGRLTFILGPSGAGKTTLMNILAERKKKGVMGSLYSAGQCSVLVGQHATLLDTLTAMETLRFAACLKLPHSTNRERIHTISQVARQLGIQDALNTRAGNLSGGERKRLTVACELLADPTCLLLDEPTSGLDSSSSMSVARALLSVAKSGRTVACVIHQPSSQLFNTADDVILLASGRTLYCGPLTDIPETLGRAGFVCPQYYNMADYMLEIASGEHVGNLTLLENEAKSYSYEMRRIAKSDIHEINGKVLPAEAEGLLSTKTSRSQDYTASSGQQLKALFWRCWISSLRDLHLTQIRLAAHLVVAMLMGALYRGAGADAGRIMSNTGCLFFFLLFLFFSNAMPPIHTFPVEAAVVLQQHLNKWYSLTTYCISKVLVDLPIQLLCATVFLLPAWYMTSQPLDAHRMGLAWLISVLLTILAQTFGLLVGTACEVKLGLFVIPAANIPMLMFSEFFIPYDEMPVYLRPFSTISYFRYSFSALLQTVYGFDREKLPCLKDFCMFKVPAKYLQHLNITRNINMDIAALVIWIVLLQICLICVLVFRARGACR
ncbi:ATP-binding cassette sub-family G member 4-like isoform X2 [Plodia interpunctella]|uniref:ATP-binding cassette sub-family G member 4-like isoform X2 n=1 Tax=Plodia interpunctella TaxID=58824 RepID=UPI002367F915|nr:ATP-binding cassette sub-family G member 4-like isoform X2 [Plodia interpunctella]